MRLLAILGLLAITVSASAAASPRAVPPIAYGVADDASKYADDGGARFYAGLPGAGLTQEPLGKLADDPRWKRLDTGPGQPVWTDEFSNILSVVRWFH